MDKKSIKRSQSAGGLVEWWCCLPLKPKVLCSISGTKKREKLQLPSIFYSHNQFLPWRLKITFCMITSKSLHQRDHRSRGLLFPLTSPRTNNYFSLQVTFLYFIICYVSIKPYEQSCQEQENIFTLCWLKSITDLGKEKIVNFWKITYIFLSLQGTPDVLEPELIFMEQMIW